MRASTLTAHRRCLTELKTVGPRSCLSSRAERQGDLEQTPKGSRTVAGASHAPACDRRMEASSMFDPGRGRRCLALGTRLGSATPAGVGLPPCIGYPVVAS